MVEMRWFVNSEVAVLQYRQLVTYSVADGNLYTHLIDKQPVWSDWIDVPTVTE